MEKKDQIIKQHNFLTTARYEMSALQKNIIYVMTAQLKDTVVRRKYKVPLSLLQKEKGVRIRKEEVLLAAKKLIASGLSIYNEEQKKFVTVGILASAEDQRGYLLLEFDAKIHPFLFNLKERFTTYRLQAALSLKSKYSKRLYEMLSQFKDTGVMKITVQELKLRLGLIDPSTLEERYADFHMFTQKVIKVAQEELPQCTELSFTYMPLKTGRKYTHLVFSIECLNAKPLAKSIGPSQKEAPLQDGDAYAHPDLSGEGLEQYLYMTKQVRWLDKKMAYKVVKTLPANYLWTCISKYQTMVRKGGDDRIAARAFFNQILEKFLATPKIQPTWGVCYNKLIRDFGLSSIIVQKLEKELVHKTTPEALLGFLEGLSDEISQKEIAKTQSRSYVKERLMEEYNLSP